MPENNPPAQARPRRVRSSVTADEILLSAEHVARDGFDALTMRAVATQMGASPMALYRYFATKDELIDAMLDRVLGRIELAPPTDDWLADLTAFAAAHRAVLSDHPWAIVPLFTHSNPGVNATVIGETALEILRARRDHRRRRGGDLLRHPRAELRLVRIHTARDATRTTVDPEADAGRIAVACCPPNASL